MKSLLIRLMPAALLCLALTACGGGGAVGQTPMTRRRPPRPCWTPARSAMPWTP